MAKIKTCLELKEENNIKKIKEVKKEDIEEKRNDFELLSKIKL